MRTSWKAVTLLFSLLFPACVSNLVRGTRGHVREGIARPPEHALALERWQIQHMHCYTMLQARERGFTPLPPDTVLLTVLADSLACVELYPKGGLADRNSWREYRTVTQLFGMISCFDPLAWDVRVTYDSQCGFPASVRVLGRRAGVAGGGYDSWRVQSLMGTPVREIPCSDLHRASREPGRLPQTFLPPEVQGKVPRG